MTLDGKLECLTWNDKPLKDESAALKCVQYTLEVPHPKYTEVHLVYTAKIDEIMQETDMIGIFKNVAGIVSLECKEKMKKRIKHRRLISFFPPKIETTVEEVWKESPYWNFSHYASWNDQSEKCRIISGDFGLHSGYRDHLAERCDLSDQFMNELFQPIELKILEWYNPQLERQARLAKESADNYLRRNR